MAVVTDPDTARIDVGTLFSEVWQRKWRIAGITVGLMALTFVVLLFVPKMYESSASILVEPRTSTFLRASNDTGAGSSGGSVSDDMAIASQVELIQSRDTLVAVIESADLRSEPELNTASSGIVGLIGALLGSPPKKSDVTETVLANMKQRLTVVRERDSRIINILFRSENPVLAAKVANAIANAHVSRRAGQEIADTADASKWLETELDKMRQKVADADAKVANFRIRNDLYTGQDGKTSLVDQQLSGISTQITQSRERQSTATSRAGVLRALIKEGKPIDSVPAVQSSTVIKTLAQQKSDLQGKRAELLARLLPNHPSVKAVTAQISEIDAQMVAEGKRIADALDAEADIEAKIQTSLRDQLTQLKSTASADLTNGVTLAELEREAKAQRDLFETYLMRYRDASARTDVSSALPDVRVVTAAAPSLVPASPKTTLILIAVMVIALAGQIGAILFNALSSGRAIVDAAAIMPLTPAAAVAPVRAVPAEPEDFDAPGDEDEPDDVYEPAFQSAPEVIAEPDMPEDVPMEMAEAEAELAAMSEPALEDLAPAPPAEPAMRHRLRRPPSAEPPADWASRLAAAAAAPAGAASNAMPADIAPDGAAETEPVAAAAEAAPHSEPAPPAAALRNWAAQLASVSSLSSAPAPDPAPRAANEPKPASSAAVRATEYVPRGGRGVQVEKPRRRLPQALKPLVDAITAGRERVVIVSSFGDPEFANSVIEQLASACAALGLGVATIDAASGRPSANPGLGDLLVGAASFGDVVHADRAGHMARVPWGRRPKLDHRSANGVTLAEALSDIYHVVLIASGRPGPESSLPVFAGIDGYVVVASAHAVDPQTLAGFEAGAGALGFSRVQIVSDDDSDARVA